MFPIEFFLIIRSLAGFLDVILGVLYEKLEFLILRELFTFLMGDFLFCNFCTSII